MKTQKSDPKIAGMNLETEEGKNEVVVTVDNSIELPTASIIINGKMQRTHTTTSTVPVECLRFELDGEKQKKKLELPFKLTKFEVYATPPFFKGTFEPKT